MKTGRIDVTKIDKEKLFIGKKGTYLDFVIIDTPNSEYGNAMIVESITKEEREAGKKGTILGNIKEFKKDTKENPSKSGEDVENLPF